MGQGQPPVVIVVPRQTVHWVIALLLAIIATILVVRDGGMGADFAMAQQQGMVGARGLFAFTGPLGRDRTGLFMMDVDAGTVWCYEFNVTKGRMRLVAARSFRNDRFLENYNQDSPSPDEARELLNVQRQAQLRATNIQQGQMAVPALATQPGKAANSAVSGS